MKRQTVTIALLVIFNIIMATWLPCQAGDNAIYGCANKKNGQLRLSINPIKCSKSEYPVTLGTVTQSGQLACVTANAGWSEDGVGVSAEISYQKNITLSDWSEVFDLLVGDPNPQGGYKFGLSCKNDWIMVSCTQSDGAPLDIDLKDYGCGRDEAIPNDPASIYVTCCKIM
jgi:hypothetical protein